MIRASGAILMITALQIATASFAVPKSVMKTITGCRAGSFCASRFAVEAHPASNAHKTRITLAPKRFPTFISAPHPCMDSPATSRCAWLRFPILDSDSCRSPQSRLTPRFGWDYIRVPRAGVNGNARDFSPRLPSP